MEINEKLRNAVAAGSLTLVKKLYPHHTTFTGKFRIDLIKLAINEKHFDIAFYIYDNLNNIYDTERAIKEFWLRMTDDDFTKILERTSKETLKKVATDIELKTAISGATRCVISDRINEYVNHRD